MTPEEAKALADAWLTKTRGEPCAVFGWSAREARTHWRFFWNTVAAMENRAEALKGVEPVAVDKRSGEVHFDSKSEEDAPNNAHFPPRARGPVDSEATAKAIVQGWLDATSEHWCSITQSIALSYGWAFIYMNDEYLRTRDPLQMVVGHGPVVVLKESGDLYALGSAKNLEATLADFERTLPRRT